MKSIVKLIDDYLEHTVCGICLTTMTGCILLQVILRCLFSQASAWAEELAIYCMIAGVYFGACLGVKERAHIRIVMLVKCMPRRIQVACIGLADLIGQANTAGQNTKHYFAFFTVALVAYLIVSALSLWGQVRLEKVMTRHLPKAEGQSK